MSESDFSDSLVLLKEAKCGDRRALAALLVRYQDRLLGRIRLMMGPKARRVSESVDFLQGVMAEVVRDFDRFEVRGDRQFLAWATEIARHNIQDDVRKVREQSFEAFSGAPLVPRDTPSTTPSRVAMRNERLHHVAEALEQLSQDHRAAIELRDFDGLSYRDIGERLGRSENAAQHLHTRAVIELGRQLSRELG